jgi:hypothetical protein
MGLCLWEGERHCQGIVIAEPGGLSNKGVMHIEYMMMRDVTCPLGEDARQRRDVCHQGDILWVDGVDEH